MASNFAQVSGRVCECGDPVSDLDVDHMDCGGSGLILKSDEPWVHLTPKMIADLVDALVEWQNQGGEQQP